MALIGLGFRELSMSPASIGPVKAMILQLDAGRIAALIEEELNRPGVNSVRPALAAFAGRHAIPL